MARQATKHHLVWGNRISKFASPTKAPTLTECQIIPASIEVPAIIEAKARVVLYDFIWLGQET